ncbi:hypothetical protein [Oligoflexus tunisiensis]|uniref:hypothetical protein n=1 Tax=Oligoflexus tunisiensis TaxID=708132 RepID=UPI00114CA8B5|nr:hypothetical protein [Oligoflexus tunisiensis]
MKFAMLPFMLLALFESRSLYGKMSCPEGYVAVSKDIGVSNDRTVPPLGNDFCIMKYEAKRDKDSDKPLSNADGEVWVSIDRSEAEKKCESIGQGYHLVSLPEWQTLARDLENEAENWSGREPFVGEINQGHVNPFPNVPLPASEEPGYDPCHLTGKSCSNGVWSRFRRTHQLRSGDIIWDVSGNVWEWLRLGLETYVDEIELKDLYNQNNKLEQESPLKDGFVSSAKGVVRKWLGPSKYYGALDVPTLGSLWLSLNMGTEVLLDSKGKNVERSKGGIIRGGSFGSTLDAGIFSANMIVHAKEKKLNIGFRCVYHPDPSEVKQ